MKTLIQLFLKLLKALVGCSVYVWGGNGEDLMQMTDAQRAAYFEKHETESKSDGKITYTKAQNIARDEALFQKMKAKGYNVIRAFDCSGLVYYVLKQLFPNQKDKATRHFYEMCNPSTDKTGMKFADLSEGDFVFKHDGKKIVHIGVFTGGKKIIDAAGRDSGVVERKIDNGFNRFGRWPALQEEAPQPEPQPQPQPEPQKGVFVLTKGNVYVRQGNGKYGADGKENPIIGKHSVKKGTKLPYIGQAEEDPYWYEVLYLEQRGYITSKPQYTTLVEE